MRTMRTLIFCIVGVWGSVVIAQAETNADYWPLDRGNRWVYEHRIGVLNAEGLRIDFREQVLLEILNKEKREGETYFRLNTGQLIRSSEKGDILEYNDRFDEIQDSEMLVFDFSSPTIRDDGVFVYRVPFHRGGVYDDFSIPEGEFINVLTCAFTYSPNPISDGTMSIIFAPNIGIISSGWSGNDVGEFDQYLLVEAVIAGEQKFPTNISTSSWGEVKEITFQETESKKGD